MTSQTPAEQDRSAGKHSLTRPGNKTMAITTNAGHPTDTQQSKTLIRTSFCISIEITQGGGRLIESDLSEELQALVLGHACAGIDVSSAAYMEGLETAQEAIWNRELPVMKGGA